jgi:HD-GYP domain-containing protein (c-di-GMP phosphodiesterase class II)
MLTVEIIYDQTRELFNQLVQEMPLRDYLHYLKTHQFETHEHCLRVCLLSLDIGYENKLYHNEMIMLGYASLLHDFGKLKIPKKILSKPRGLDSSEYQVIQGHVRKGFTELTGTEFEIVKEIIVAHHEFTNKPYPRNGKDRRETIRSSSDRRANKSWVQKIAQIIALADMLDALVHARAYKVGYSKDATEQILRDEYRGNEKYIDQALQRLAS